MKKTAYDMLYFTVCAVNGIQPDTNRIAHVDLEKLFQMCQFHSLTAIVCMGLEAAGITDQKFIEAKAKAIRKNILLDAERASILDFMEQNKIWYVPLKGIILKELYPKIGMRQMSDNDILYDKAYQKQVCKMMQNRGYTVESVGKKHHDTYLKPPVYNFELHTDLFEKKRNKIIYQYYTAIKKRLVPDDQGKYGFSLSNEDFYIYMTTHEYKHFSRGGTGLRSLLDCFVFLKAKGGTLDWAYIQAQTDLLKITDFEQKSRKLSKKIFENPDVAVLSEDEREMLEYYLFSGTYGTMNNVITNQIQTFAEQSGCTSKFEYILHRIFPPMEHYKQYFPFFYRHKILLPVAWIFRLINGITVRRKYIKKEISHLHDSDRL